MSENRAFSAQIIDGKAVAAQIGETLKERVAALKERGKTPGLVVIQVGDNPASSVYVRNKHRMCKKLGIFSVVDKLPEEITQEELLEKIDAYNQDERFHGILVQLPLPSHIDEGAVIRAIDPKKDVDGFHPISAGSLMTGARGFVPCTPKGAVRLIESTGTSIAGKNAVVVGRSNIVGKPMAMLLLEKNATVTVCHSKTVDLPAITSRADILVAAVGRPEMLTGEYVKPGAIVIDVGINRTENGLVGDVKFDEAAQKAAYITPVPGGVGPMTIIMLMENTVEACERA